MIGLVWFLVASLGAAPQPSKPKPVSQERVVELYTTTCQLCHGPNGTGSPLTKGSAFVGRKWKHGNTQAAVVKTITNGVANTPMLPFKDKFSPQEIAALATLVRSFDKKPKL